MSDRLSRGEKLALTFLVAGQVLSIFTWYLGKEDQATTIGPLLPWIRLIFAIVASAALDLVVVITTTGRRDGRRSRWSWATIFSAAAFSAMIALDVAGGPTIGPFLHVAYAVNIFLFAQHTAVPRVAVAVPRRPRQLRALVYRLARALRAARAEIAAAHDEAAALREEIARLRARPAAPAAPPAPSRAQIVAYAQRALASGRPLEEVARELGFAASSLRDWIKAASNGHAVEA